MERHNTSKRLSETQRNCIIHLHNEGKSFGYIARKLNTSVIEYIKQYNNINNTIQNLSKTVQKWLTNNFKMNNSPHRPDNIIFCKL